jgi:hypothetical protein
MMFYRVSTILSMAVICYRSRIRGAGVVGTKVIRGVAGKVEGLATTSTVATVIRISVAAAEMKLLRVDNINLSLRKGEPNRELVACCFWA